MHAREFTGSIELLEKARRNDHRQSDGFVYYRSGPFYFWFEILPND